MKDNDVLIEMLFLEEYFKICIIQSQRNSKYLLNNYIESKRSNERQRGGLKQPSVHLCVREELPELRSPFHPHQAKA